MMRTVLIKGQGFNDAAEVYEWARSIVGRTAPGESKNIVKQIVQVNLSLDVNTYKAILLAEVGHS